MPPQKPMTEAQEGEWSYAPVPRLAAHFMANETVRMVAGVAAAAYRNPHMVLIGVDP